MSQFPPANEVPNTVIVMGKREAAARPWLRRMALLALAASSLAAGSALAHGPHGHDTRYDPISRTAPAAHKASLVDNSLLSRAISGRLSWASSQTGKVDGKALLASWEDAGLTPSQGMELVSVLFHTQSPVLARTQEARQMAQKASQATASLLEIKSYDQANAFLRARSIDALADSGILTELVRINVPDSYEASSWSEVYAYWDKLHVQTYNQQPSGNLSSSPQQVSRALSALSSAVDRAGLAGLQIPLGVWGDADQMNDLATKVVQANNTLSELSGLSGQALGLNGRVFYTPTAPLDNAFAYKASSSMVQMAALWEDVPHEWIHAVDMTNRVGHSVNNAVGGASLSHEVGSSRNSPVSQAWGAMVDKFTDQSNPVVLAWSTSRTKYTSQSDAAAEYLNSSFELVAYVWGSYVQSQQKPGDVFYDPSRDDRPAYNGIGPTLKQASTFASSWKDTFSAVNDYWWAGQPVATDTTTANATTKINLQVDFGDTARQNVANMNTALPRL